MNLVSILKRHYLFFLILIIASVIRLYHIRSEVIFIGDQARDYFVAKRMVIDGDIPLLGIPSSIPRFSQGPLFIYITALTQVLFGFDPNVMAILTALIGIICVVLIYVLVTAYADKRSALIASALFAFSSMAILHARMPWVLSFIPFFSLLYFHQLLRIIHRREFASFLAGLFFALLFHNELATAPLLVLILYALWRQKKIGVQSQSAVRQLLLTLLGIGIGLLPQLIHDFTHNFSQIGGFSAWVLYRIGSAFVPGTDHTLFHTSIWVSFTHIFALITTIFHSYSHVGFIFGWAFVLLFVFVYGKNKWQTLSEIGKLSYIGSLVLILAFCIHRSPSEAYMPGLIIPLLLTIGIVVSKTPKLIQYPLLLLMLVATSMSIYTLVSRNFYLASYHENNWESKFFGPSLATQKIIIDEAQGLAGRVCVRLFSHERAETFPTHIANLEYVLNLSPLQQGKNLADCTPIAIDRSNYKNLSALYGDMSFDLGSYRIQEMKE